MFLGERFRVGVAVDSFCFFFSRFGDVVEYLLKSQWFVRCREMGDRVVQVRLQCEDGLGFGGGQFSEDWSEEIRGGVFLFQRFFQLWKLRGGLWGWSGLERVGLCFYLSLEFFQEFWEVFFEFQNYFRGICFILGGVSVQEGKFCLTVFFFRLWSSGFWSLVRFFIRRIGSIGFFILGKGWGVFVGMGREDLLVVLRNCLWFFGRDWCVFRQLWWGYRILVYLVVEEYAEVGRRKGWEGRRGGRRFSVLVRGFLVRFSI